MNTRCCVLPPVERVVFFAPRATRPYTPVPTAASMSGAAPSRHLAEGQECYPHVARVPTVPFDKATHPLTQTIYYGEASHPAAAASTPP